MKRRCSTRIPSAHNARKRIFKAFTLIELLVVIVIIGILVAILFPVFASAREKARQTTCASNMRQIGMAIMSYVQDYDETYPGALDDSWDVPWSVLVTPYINSVQAFHCPDDPGSVPDSDNYSWGTGPEMSYVVNGNYQYNVDAGTNQFGGLFVPWGDFDQWGDPSVVARTVSQVTFPSSTIAVAEHDAVWLPESGCTTDMGALYSFGRSYVGLSWEEGACSDGTYSFGSQLIPGSSGATATSNPYDASGPNGGVMPVHGGMANFAFADGHVKAMNPVATNPNMYAAGNAGNMWFATRAQL